MIGPSHAVSSLHLSAYGPLSFSNERMEMLTLKKWQTTFCLLGWQHKGGQKECENQQEQKETAI